MRWNLSSRARELSGGDPIMISVSKSGRTWVRVFLCTYFCKRKLEAAGAFDEKIVQSRDIGDPESFSVCPEKVGGDRDYLSLEDQAFAA
jgi:hypothetical protein